MLFSYGNVLRYESKKKTKPAQSSGQIMLKYFNEIQ